MRILIPMDRTGGISGMPHDGGNTTVMTAPLVSVMMPSFNANATLPRAMASLVAQTYANWECVLVDDGSSESPAGIVAAADDERIRLITLDRNYGRGVARQVALDNARGEYLAMLDADDWMFPTRIADQVAIMTTDLDLALVSSSMATVDGANELVTVRPATDDGERFMRYTLTQPGTVPVNFAPSMIRMSIARQGHFAEHYLRSEDHDFLRMILLNRSFARLPVLHYAYAEQNEMDLAKILQSHRYKRASLRQYLRRYPRHIGQEIAQSWATSAAYRLAFAVGAEQRLIARRSHEPTARDRQAFAEARARVDAVQARIFGAPVVQDTADGRKGTHA